VHGGALIAQLKAKLSRLRWRAPLALFVLATLAFQLVLDFRIIPPQSLAWIFAWDADPAGYYLASAYYRNAAWHFPITEMENLLHPVGASFAMMDAVPVAGILTKLLSFALPADFQYLGLWLYSCVLLNAVFGYLVLGRLVEDRALRWAGTCLITLAPPLVTRFVHTALSTHWLLLASFWTVLEDRTLPKKRLWSLAALSWFVSPVLMVMVNAILVGVFWVHRRDRRQVVIAALGWVSVLVGSAALLGYFNLRESTAKLHPFFFSDLTSLVSSFGTSSIVPSLPTRREPGGYYAPWALGENFAYLGLGGILLLLALLADTVARWLARDPRRRPSAAERVITLSCLAMAGYAISPSPYFLGEPWDGIPALTRLLEPVLMRLRVPARFLWPLFYFVLVFGTRAAERWLARLARPAALKVAAAVIVVLQAADLGPWLLEQGRNPAFVRPPPLPVLPDFLARRWTPRTRFMIFDPPIQRETCSSRKARWSSYDERSFALALFGIRHQLITNTDFRISARLSRRDLGRVCRHGDEVNRSSGLRPDVMIVTTADQHRQSGHEAPLRRFGRPP
jgi:hypothetical protein